MIRRVEAGGFGDEGEVDAFFLAEGKVFFERLGVVLEVFGAVELNGIDEN